MSRQMSTYIKTILQYCFIYSMFGGINSVTLRCYVCKLGCDYTAGYLQNCPEPNRTLWGSENWTPLCYKYHVKPEELVKYNTAPDSTDVTRSDLKFKLPREYRNCVFRGSNAPYNILYNVSHDKYENESKFNYHICDELACNGQDNSSTTVVSMRTILQMLAIWGVGILLF